MDLEAERQHVYETVAAELPPLRGTEKQKEWAQDIRAGWLRRQVTERITLDGDRFRYWAPTWIDGTRNEYNTGRDALIKQLTRSRQLRDRGAASWIDRRPRPQATPDRD
jgi:hypothetical protein